MTKNTNFNFKSKIKKMQLSFSFDLTNNFEVDDKVFLVHNIVEEMNLSFLDNAYSNKGRKPIVEPKTMIKVLVFAYLNRKYSARDIEDACKYDLRFRWLLDNGKSPDHVTINRFRNKIYPFMDEILAELIDILIEEGEVDLKTIYIDGSKIEANANKYTFVWHKSIENYQGKLKEKIIKYFNIEGEISLTDTKKLLLIEFNKIRNICKSNKIIFVYGSGMGKRNSYSKTDHDATFMRMKDDHMRNGQLKPGYNIQCATNGNYIIGIEGFSNPADVGTLKPFMNGLLDKYDSKINRLVADSGYESEENYVYLKEKNIESFIKPSNYEIKKKRKYKNDISRKTNMVLILKQESIYVRNV